MSKRRRQKSRRNEAKDLASPTVRTAAAAPSRPSFREMGGTGLRISGGQIMEEYNPDLQGVKLYDEFDRMLRGDGQVHAVELVISLPIEALDFRVQPNEAGETIDLTIAEEFETNLMEGMTSTFGSMISEAVSAVMIGVNLLEKVWEFRDGQTRLQKLAPRHPRTIQQWIFDANGGIQGIVQRVVNPVTSQSEDRPIPIDSLLRFTYREHGGDPTGRPLMRPMRTHHMFKHVLYKVGHIGIERFAVPSLWGRLPANYTASDKQEYLALLESVRVAARGAGVLPPGYELPALVEGGQRLPDILRWIEYHDQLIARTGLAQFLNLGSGSTGSFALSDSQVELFLLAMEQIADWICEVVNRYLIPQWVGYNYPGVDRFCKLTHSAVARLLQRTQLLTTLTSLVQGQIVTQDPDLENLVRDMLGLPPAPDRQQSAPPTDETIPQEEQGASRYNRILAALNRGEELSPWEWTELRNLREAAGRPSAARPDRDRLARTDRAAMPKVPGGAVGEADLATPHTAAASHRQIRPRDDAHFDETHRRLTAAKDQFVGDMSALVKRQHAALVKKLQPIIDDYRSSDDLSKGTHIKRMLEIEVPMVPSYAKLIADWQRQFYVTARDEAAAAAGLEPPTTISNALRTHIAVKGDVIAQKHAEALRSAVLLQLLQSLRRELPSKQLSWNLTQIARKRTSLDLRKDFVDAGDELIELLNTELAQIDLPEEIPA